MRLTGISLGALAQTDQTPDFDAVLRQAVDLLEGRVEAGSDPDELRDRLLEGYRFILVDEYQDIDALQYALVSALAGRTRKDGDTKLTIMAVGDDDQNIYSFRKTSVEFIRRFEADYEAEKSYLVENFRSTQHIISAANAVIQPAPDRMKVDAPIRIDHARSAHRPGGRWAELDPVGHGLVQLVRIAPDPNIQAQLAMAELLRLRALDPTADWADFAVLARTHASLEPIRAYCEWKGIAYRTGEQGQGGLSAVKTREGHRVIAALRRRPSRMVRSRALSRWLTGLAAVEPENPWLADLRDCAIELESAVGGAQVPRADAIDWLYESAGAHARQAPGHLNLLTAHGAKGREFAHVLVLDAGDWPTESAGRAAPALRRDDPGQGNADPVSSDPARQPHAGRAGRARGRSARRAEGRPAPDPRAQPPTPGAHPRRRAIWASPAASRLARLSIRPLQPSSTGTHCASTTGRSSMPRGRRSASSPRSASCRPAKW